MANDPPLASEQSRAEVLFHAITEAASCANVSVVVLQLGTDALQVKVVYMNDAVERLLGSSQAEMLAEGVWRYVAPECLPAIQELAQTRARGELGPDSFNTTLVHKSGRRVHVEIAVGRIVLDGESGAVAFVVDTTARDEARAALSRSQEMFRQVINSAPDGIMIFRWPKIAFANPAAARLLEVASPEQAVGLDITERMVRDEVTSAAQRVTRMQQGELLSAPRQYRLSTPSGQQRSLEISSLPITFEHEPAVLSFARDVSERNNMLTKLIEADKLAAISAIAAGVAHEINNPLAYVLLNLEFLARELRELGVDPERAEAMQRRLTDTRQGAERVKAIVRDLQTLTRKDENIRGAIELDQVIESALQMARHEIRQRARVETDFAPVPCITGNATRLEQLFFNLLENAAHAVAECDPARSVIRVAIRLGARGFVNVEVCDNGCGMTDDVEQRAFEPFFTTKPLGVGSGLGLPIAKRIVDDLGGSIAMHSQPGKGTLITVALHVYEEPVSDRPVQRRRGRVLVVDDERAVAESLHFALRDEHDVDVATSGQAARAVLDAGTDYDVVLCDLVMPVESGMDLHAYAQEHHPQIAERFVFMTGGAFTQRAARFLAEVRSPRIDKPFDLEPLRALIEGMVAARDS